MCLTDWSASKCERWNDRTFPTPWIQRRLSRPNYVAPPNQALAVFNDFGPQIPVLRFVVVVALSRTPHKHKRWGGIGGSRFYRAHWCWRAVALLNGHDVRIGDGLAMEKADLRWARDYQI